MKYCILILLFFSPLSFGISLGGGIGWSFNGVDPENVDPDEVMVNVFVQSSAPTFVGLKILKYKSSKSETLSSSYIGAFIGRKLLFKERLFFESAIGYGYLNTPDGQTTEGGRLTNKQQFIISNSMGLKFKAFSIKMTYDHLSNCATMCNRSESNFPNVGRDFIVINFEKKFD